MKRLCQIRDLQRAVYLFELQFEKKYGISLNEGMVLCSLSKTASLSSGELGELLGLSSSNTSKVICSVEKKGYVERVVGTKDKRNMYFSLTASGRDLLDNVSDETVEMPDSLRALFTGE
ncbi:MAG TPA: MarR family transcriptional regulator [Candidatus Paraprevotella stercorigallinarum]|nr:MarR family transcriptional regulator [Candidatus Paraprevotella stercorigallinarum]